MSATRLQPGLLVYVRDNEEVWSEGEIRSQSGQLFTVLAGDKESECTEEAMLLRPSTSLGCVDSLTNLPIINQASVLSCLHERYLSGHYYTGAGSTVVAVNPFCDIPNLYSTDTALSYHLHKNTDPHIYRIGADAYSCMVRELGKINQCIIVSGESGAGKTVSAKHLVRYMTLVSSPGLSDKKLSRASVISQSIERRILDSNPILEAFGNAVTQRNDNSSRFGKFIQLQFSRAGQLEGANIKTYLLEKTRVVHQSLRECNFHIFYQIASELRENGWMFGEFYLDIDANSFKILPTGKELQDNRQLQTTLAAMSEIGLSENFQQSIVMVLIAILHLGNIEFNPLEDEMSKLVADQEDQFLDTTFLELEVTQEALQKAANILGVVPSHLEQVFLYRNITSGHNSRQSVFVKPVPQQEAYSRRDCLATVLYSRIFDWLVSYINSQIHADVYSQTIGLLDIYGFEAFEKNSLEQLCINYANEKLQQHYVKQFLKDLQKEYDSERISWKFMDYTDNQPCLDVLEGQPSVFGLLNEEVQLSRKSDTRSLCERILALSTNKHSCIQSKSNKTYVKTPKYFHKNPGFTICHYAGEVTYKGEELTPKNKDNVPHELIAMLQGSSNLFVSGLFEDLQVEDTKGRKRKTVLSKFKASLDSLILALKSSDVHYIRCIKPNTQCQPGVFDRKYVMSQLVASGIIETVEVSQQGFPARMCYSSFLQRYGLIIRNVPPSTRSCLDSESDENLLDMVFKSQYDLMDSPRRTPTPKKRLRRRAGLSSVDHTRRCCAAVMKIQFGSSTSLIKQFGKTKLFLHQHQLELLEKTRLEVLSGKAGLIQRAWRWYHYRKTKQHKIQAAQKIQMAWRRFQDNRRKDAVITIQKNFRMVNARKWFIEMQQKAKKQQQEKEKSWRPIIDRKRKSSSQSRPSSRSNKRSSSKKLSCSNTGESTLSCSTLSNSIPSSRDTTLSSSYTSNTSMESRKSGLSPNLSSLSLSGEDTENLQMEPNLEHPGLTEIPQTSGTFHEKSVQRLPFSNLKDINEKISSVPSVKKRKVEGGCKTTLEDLNMGDGILTRRRLPKVPIRFHTRPSVLKNAHIVHQRELTCGLQDCLPDDQSKASFMSYGKENEYY